MNHLGEQFERYELMERIAIGGMAEVFRAKSYGSHGFEKVVAIKRILPELASSAEFERRFIAEAKLACELTHANIVQILDFSRFRESLYIVMEFVDGVDLARLLAACEENRQRVPLAACLHIAIELCKGLEFAHNRNIIHRDISPANILISRFGEVKIADFGIAKAAGMVTSRSRKHIMGKWRYMSPEQTRGTELDHRSDLFSAATVLFELFSGRKLFLGQDAETIVKSIHDMEVPRLSEMRKDTPAALDELIAAALTRDRLTRTAAAAQLRQGFVDISYAHGVKATAASLADFVATHQLHITRKHQVPAAKSMRLIDDIINSELQRSRHQPDEATQPGLPARVTMLDARPPAMTTEDQHKAALLPLSAPNDDDDDDDESVEFDDLEGATTLVRIGRSSNGDIAKWVIERQTSTEHPSSTKHSRAILYGALIAILLAIVTTLALLW